MKLLTRYLIYNNLFLLCSILLIGTGIYLLTDLFDRLDQFLDAGVNGSIILWYYLVKTPLIISQILPAVFLIACIVQLSLMTKSREITALQAGGVSPAVFVRFILVYGLVWALAQLAFSQALGVQGDRLAGRIWKEDVRGKEVGEVELTGLWFTDGSEVVHLGLAYPETGKGKDFLAYRLTDNGTNLERIVRAESFTITQGSWVLHNVVIIAPEHFSYERVPEMSIVLHQDLSAFTAIDPGANLASLPVWRLGESIRSLEASGSNVEGLRTALHAKLAYAASLIAMGLLALAVVLWTANIYAAVGVGLLVTFLFFAVNMIFNTMGEKGLIAPVVAGWFADAAFVGLGLAAIFYKTRKPRSGA